MLYKARLECGSYIARRDSTRQNSFVELSRVGRCDQGLRQRRQLLE